MNDLKAGNFAIVLNKSGFSQNQINATKNIYLLSERGYSKLLKMHSAENSAQYKMMFCDVDKSERKSLIYKACPNFGLWSNNDFSDKTIINESGMYSLIMNSQMPNAKQHKNIIQTIDCAKYRSRKFGRLQKDVS